MEATSAKAATRVETRIFPVKPSDIKTNPTALPSLDDWDLRMDMETESARNLQEAAFNLSSTDVPISFPTETVYGLGADATRSSAVLGIYRAKGRPADNPLIVHFHSLNQLRKVLRPRAAVVGAHEIQRDTVNGSETIDPIPQLYKPLIDRFWPGPLTLIMPNPVDSILAPEVTAGLKTFGARIPSSPIALALIKLADLPLAAPSANASTKPSPTTAQHVKHDLNMRISTIIDGGSCDVGLESTVVDGLSKPPAILRPGGISIEALRACPGWEDVQIGYKNNAQSEVKPRAPGMKYKHYSPEAKMLLFEPGVAQPDVHRLTEYAGQLRRIGIVRTVNWVRLPKHHVEQLSPNGNGDSMKVNIDQIDSHNEDQPVAVYDIDIGQTPAEVARNLFSALRRLDAYKVNAILVEGIDEALGDVAAAVMNRMKKAAEVLVTETGPAD